MEFFPSLKREIGGWQTRDFLYNTFLIIMVSLWTHQRNSLECVLSLFRRAFAPFHSFTVLVSTRGFKRASPSRIKGPGDLGFKERVMLRGYRAYLDSWL